MQVYAKRTLPDGTILETNGKIHLVLRTLICSFARADCLGSQVDLAGSECAKSAEKGDKGQQESKDQVTVCIS